MFENEKDLFGDFGSLDLGSDLGADFAEFTPIDDNTDMSSIFGEEKKEAETQPETIQQETPAENAVQKTEEFTEPAKKDEVTEAKENEGTKTTNQQSVEVKEEPEQNADTEPDLFEQAVAKAENKEAENIIGKLTEKLPIFSFDGAKEEIVDTSITFEQLRKEKAEDFADLDEAKYVTWEMKYGSIIKKVSSPTKNTIAALKKEIESSKDFAKAVKKSKGEIECFVIPKTHMKDKGILSSYKGTYTNLQDALESDKTISFVPSSDGKVYEVRKGRMGTFIAAAKNVSILDKVKPGFIPALPKIPYNIFCQAVAFFKSFVNENEQSEALVYIYWSCTKEEYFIEVPYQLVTKERIKAKPPIKNDDEKILVAEFHSHDVWKAKFSDIDNRDEKATGIYIVIGELDKFCPSMSARISVAGKFVEIDAGEIFETEKQYMFPEKWRKRVKVKAESEYEMEAA